MGAALTIATSVECIRQKVQQRLKRAEILQIEMLTNTFEKSILDSLVICPYTDQFPNPGSAISVEAFVAIWFGGSAEDTAHRRARVAQVQRRHGLYLVIFRGPDLILFHGIALEGGKRVPGHKTTLMSAIYK